jgi:outer membrane lipoprotein SlyB
VEQNQIKEIEKSIEKNQNSIKTILTDVFTSYKNRGDLELPEWIKRELQKYDVYQENDEKEIINSTKTFIKNKEELEETIQKGGSLESYLSKKIEEGAKYHTIAQVGEYAHQIDEAIEKANETLIDTYINKSGTINQNPQLHGFVAEEHHVNSFNMEAATQGSEYRAEMLQSTSKNSVDIVIKDKSGNIVRKYNAKYGQTAKDTENYIKKGDYRGQRKLVPADQQKDIKNSTDVIESPDGVKSKPLTREEAKKIQEKLQKEKNLREYNWDRVSKREMVSHISQETAKNVLLHSAMNAGARMLKRGINFFKGEKNPPLQEELKAWFNDSVKGGKEIGLRAVISTGATIVVRKGLLSKVLQNTPADRIVRIGNMAMDNVKILYKVAKGEITLREGLKQMQYSTASTIGGLMGAADGTALGTMIGSVLGPVGSVVGGFVGGVVGGMAGSKIGEKIVDGYHKVKEVTSKAVDTVVSGVKSAVNKVVDTAKSVVDKVKSLFS